MKTTKTYTLTFSHATGIGGAMDTEGLFFATDEGPQGFSILTTEQAPETARQRLRDAFRELAAGGYILIKNAAGKFEALTPQEI